MSPGHRRAATLATLLLLAVLPTAFSGDSITQLVQDQTYVGVGFDTLDPGPHTLTMTLQATGANNEISSSWAWDPYGWVLWTSNDANQTLLIHQWTANGVLGEDVATPQFDGTTTQPAGTGGWFTVTVSHVDVDLDPALSPADDETEATTGVGMPITFNGPDLPASFPLTEEAGRNLWVAVTSDAGGTLHFDGTGAQLEVYQIGATGWEKVTGGIPVPPGGLYDTFVVHTSNQFTGPVMLKARLDHGTTTLDAADTVKVVYEEPPEMELTAPNGNTVARIGFDYTLNYTLRGTANFDTVELQIHNDTNGLVFKKTGLPTALGDHSVVWDAVKWNQGGATTMGAYANPNRGTYSAKLVGTRGGVQVESPVLSLTTQFIIEFTLRDDLPGNALPGAIPAGLDLLGNGFEVALWSYFPGTSSWNNPHTFDYTQFQITKSADASSGSTSPNVAQVRVENTTLDSLGSGTWRIEVRYARDDVGNFLDTDTSTEIIDHYKWTIRLQ